MCRRISLCRPSATLPTPSLTFSNPLPETAEGGHELAVLLFLCFLRSLLSLNMDSATVTPPSTVALKPRPTASSSTVSLTPAKRGGRTLFWLAAVVVVVVAALVSLSYFIQPKENRSLR